MRSPLIICPNATKFDLLSVHTLIQTICVKRWAKPPPKNEESSLPVNVRVSKTSLRKLANDELCWFDLPALAICFFPSPKSCVFWFAEFGLLMLLFTKNCLDTFGNFPLKSKNKIKTTIVALKLTFVNLNTSLRSWQIRHVSAYRGRGGDIEKLSVPA